MSQVPTPSTAAPRFTALPEDLLLADRGRLITLDRKRRDFAKQGKAHDQLDQKFDADLKAAQERFAARKARHAIVIGPSGPEFDDALPIAERRHEIA